MGGESTSASATGSREKLGKTTTATAGCGAPSAMAGKRDLSGEEMMAMHRDTLRVEDEVGLEAIGGRAARDPASQFVFTLSFFVRLSIWRSEAIEGPFRSADISAASPVPNTYTAPPTAPARQPTCAISASPPHFGTTAPKPAPNNPIERRCRATRGSANATVVALGGCGDNVKAAKGACTVGGRLKRLDRKLWKGTSA